MPSARDAAEASKSNTVLDLPPTVLYALSWEQNPTKLGFALTRRLFSDKLPAISNLPSTVLYDLGHGNFLPWLEAEFGMHENSARNFMRVAEMFKSTSVVDLPPTVLYALAAPNTDDEVREEALRRAAAGEVVPSLN